MRRTSSTAGTRPLRDARICGRRSSGRRLCQQPGAADGRSAQSHGRDGAGVELVRCQAYGTALQFPQHVWLPSRRNSCGVGEFDDLVLISLGVFYEAYRRLLSPPEVKSEILVAVALVALAVNDHGRACPPKWRKRSKSARAVSAPDGRCSFDLRRGRSRASSSISRGPTGWTPSSAC